MLTDTTFREADFSDADMLVLPGGQPGTTYLGGFEPLTDLVKSFYNNGGKIAAICAAPTVFAEIGLLHGKKMCIRDRPGLPYFPSSFPLYFPCL